MVIQIIIALLIVIVLFIAFCGLVNLFSAKHPGGRKYPCDLVYLLKFNAKEKCIIADFSKYTDSNIVTLQIYTDEAPPQGIDDVIISSVPNAHLYQENGIWYWY